MPDLGYMRPQALRQTAGQVLVEQQLQVSGCAKKTALANSRKGETGANVIRLQLRKIRQNLLLRHPRRQIIQYVVNGYPRFPDAGLPGPAPGRNGYAVENVHGPRESGRSTAIVKRALRQLFRASF